MSGIYIHIPFCERKCAYCAFYSITAQNQSSYGAYVEAVLREASMRKLEITEPLRTLYIGGGTPSILPISLLVKLLDGLASYFDLSVLQEITLEANPEHLSGYLGKEFLSDIRKYTLINRLSIGIQSFFDEDLKRMNRRHTGKQALDALKSALKVGFDNVSGDLIYGLPYLEDLRWEKNLDKIRDFQLPHFSAYSLTVEPNTILAKQIEKHRMCSPAEEDIIRQYDILTDKINQWGYERYETSNYAQLGRYSLHNTNYWRNIPYLGLGAGAHSYNGNQRRWNISDVDLYREDPLSDHNFKIESLSEMDKYHEYIMLSLRTQWGIRKNKISEFSASIQDSFFKEVSKEIACGHLTETTNAYIALGTSQLKVDGIALNFF
ncbi:MAG: radical SAM family heme chaperone HemW [Bacteroidales bacterium]